MTATRIPFDAVRAARLTPGKLLVLAYDSPRGPQGREIDFSRLGIAESFVTSLSEHLPLERP